MSSLGTGENSWIRPGWKILPTRAGYCSNPDCARRFGREKNKVNLMRVQPHYYYVGQVGPFHR